MNCIVVDTGTNTTLINSDLIEIVEDRGEMGTIIHINGGGRVVTNSSFNEILKGLSQHSTIFALEVA